MLEIIIAYKILPSEKKQVVMMLRVLKRFLTLIACSRL